MLKELYDYAVKNDIVIPTGFKEKTIKAYVSLSAEGEFIGIENSIEKTTIAPDIGSAGQGKSKCNILVEKASIVFNYDDSDIENPNIQVKNEFFKNSLASGGEFDKKFCVCKKFLDNEENVSKAILELKENKIKSKDVIGFKIDGTALEKSTDYLEWWQKFRFNFGAEETAEVKTETALKRCLITGELTEPVKTLQPIKGLSVVGGHTKGDALICFDKAAFCSYNLEQSENACVSEDASIAVNSALNFLIAKAPIFAGAKFVYWYKEKPEQEDFLSFLNMDIDLNKKSNSDEAEEDADEINAEKVVENLLDSYKKGEKPNKTNNKYYILNLTGVSGRVMIRNYEVGSYDDLYDAFACWYNDLKLKKIYDNSLCKFPKLFTINTRLIKRMSSSKQISKRIDDELSAIEFQLIYSIIHNTHLQDYFAQKMLNYIKSDMLDSNDSESKRQPVPDSVCCQVLKAWLIRKQRMKGEKITMNEELNKDYPGVAYHVGRMMAVYAAIQRAANLNVGAGVIERYYASASTMPGMVLGKLANLSQYHFSQIDKGIAVRYSKMLDEIACKIGYKLPSVLSLQQQSEFALGYYQQNAEIFKKKNEISKDGGNENEN